MELDDIRYQAILARDPRFDGKFFYGVKTTGVYCRPICSARPKRKNIECFATANEAEGSGYRPCLRCRPDAVPGSARWQGSGALVLRALRALDEPGNADLPEEEFASRFGVGARHLRRLFVAQLGKTPAGIVADRRVELARGLIAGSGLPMTRIAGLAGYRSIRSFNAAVRKSCKRSPTEMRRVRRTAPEEGGVVLTLPFRAPFDWEESLAYYRNHCIASLEDFRDGAYERIFRGEQGRIGIVRVTLEPRGKKLRLRVSGAGNRDLGRVARAVRRMFDLDSDLAAVGDAFSRAERLHKLFLSRPGLRIPMGWDPWESAVSAILHQGVRVEHAKVLIAELARVRGEPVSHPVTGETVHLFPQPRSLAASPAPIGTTVNRKAAIQGLARAVADGAIRFSGAQDPRAFRGTLSGIKGVGAWTAEYISLRSLGDPDAFPEEDLILKRALETDPGLRWELNLVHPWRGYAAAHLWREAASARAQEAL